MNAGSCPREPALITALRTGFWSGGLRAHADSCPDCQDTSRVVQLMTAVAEAAGVREAPPDPLVAWLRAQLEQRRRLEAHRLRRAFIVACIAQVALIASAFVAAAWMSPAFVWVVEAFRPRTPVATTAALIALAALVMPAVAYVLLTRVPLRLSFIGEGSQST